MEPTAVNLLENLRLTEVVGGQVASPSYRPPICFWAYSWNLSDLAGLSAQNPGPVRGYAVGSADE